MVLFLFWLYPLLAGLFIGIAVILLVLYVIRRGASQSKEPAPSSGEGGAEKPDSINNTNDVADTNPEHLGNSLLGIASNALAITGFVCTLIYFIYQCWTMPLVVLAILGVPLLLLGVIILITYLKKHRMEKKP